MGRGPGEARGADRAQKVAAGGQETKHVRASEYPLTQEEEGARNHSAEEAICALSGLHLPALFLGDKHNTTVFTLFTALGTNYPTPALHGSSALA